MALLYQSYDAGVKWRALIANISLLLVSKFMAWK